MALAALGFFIFTLRTIPYSEWNEQTTWRHPNQSTVGSMNAPSQYTGRDPKTITLEAELHPEISGGDLSIHFLEKMADSGHPWPLIRGDGTFMGSFVIEEITRKETGLLDDGAATIIHFSMKLKKVADIALGLEGMALGLLLGVVNRAIGF